MRLIACVSIRSPFIVPIKLFVLTRIKPWVCLVCAVEQGIRRFLFLPTERTVHGYGVGHYHLFVPLYPTTRTKQTVAKVPLNLTVLGVLSGECGFDYAYYHTGKNQHVKHYFGNIDRKGSPPRIFS